jgi:hypothetical protein
MLLQQGRGHLAHSVKLSQSTSCALLSRSQWYIQQSNRHNRCQLDTRPRQPDRLVRQDKRHPDHSVQPTRSMSSAPLPRTQMYTQRSNRRTLYPLDTHPRQASMTELLDTRHLDHSVRPPRSMSSALLSRTLMCMQRKSLHSPRLQDTRPRQVSTTVLLDTQHLDHSVQPSRSMSSAPLPRTQMYTQRSNRRTLYPLDTHPRRPDRIVQ